MSGYVITELRIDGDGLVEVWDRYGSPNPERAPIGPFESREAALEYAHRLQIKYGTGGGSCEISPLVTPREEE